MRRKEAGFSVFQRGAGDGAWVLAYQLEPGQWKQKRLGFYVNEIEANRAARTWLAQQRSDGTLPAATRTVADCSQLWVKMRSANPRIAGSTVTDNNDQLKNHILPRFGETPIGKLDTGVLRAWVRELRDKVSASRCRNVVNTFSALYEDARAEGWVKTSENIVRHPAVKRELPALVSEREETVVLSLEAAQALTGDERVAVQRRLRYAFGFLTGMRDGEIAGLTWADVSLDADVPTLRVRRAHALRAVKGKHASSTDPKTSESKRTVPVHPALAEGLRWWRDEAWEAWAGTALRQEEPVFPSPRTGKAWRPKSAEDIREDLETLGLHTATEEGTPIDFHATRRSFNTWLTEAGVDKTTRDQLMGHRSKTTGERHYTGIVLRRMSVAVSCIPLRWGVAELSEFGSVPVPFDVALHSAHLVQAHNGARETAAGHLSSVVEQRFRNSLPPEPETAKNDESAETLGNVGAESDGLRAGLARLRAFEKPRRYGVSDKRARALEKKALSRIEAIVDLAIDGRTVYSVDERERRTARLLEQASAFLNERDRVAGGR